MNSTTYAFTVRLGGHSKNSCRSPWLSPYGNSAAGRFETIRTEWVDHSAGIFEGTSQPVGVRTESSTASMRMQRSCTWFASSTAPVSIARVENECDRLSVNVARARTH